MDTFKSQWSNLLATKPVIYTPRLYYRKYVVRVSFNFDRSVQIRKFLIDPQLEELAKNKKLSKYSLLFSQIAVELKRRNGSIKFRNEYHHLRVFFENEEDAASFVFSNPEFPKIVDNLMVPSNETALKKLKEGIILVKNYKYPLKVSVSAGKFQTEEVEHIGRYLKNLDETQIKLSPGLEARVKNLRQYLYGHYFINDNDILTFLRIISPNFVKEISTLEPFPE